MKNVVQVIFVQSIGRDLITYLLERLQQEFNINIAADRSVANLTN